MPETPKKNNSLNTSIAKDKPERREPEKQQAIAERSSDSSLEIPKRMANFISSSELGSLKDYSIRQLVKDAEEFGKYLKQQRLETNQIRKFLDAINQLKSKLAQERGDFSKIEVEVVLLKPKLVYAAARQQAAKPLSDVMSAAIDQVKNSEDFERLVQLIESIIAYHKAEGGK